MTERVEHRAASRHKCLIYDGDPARQLPVIAPFLIDALQRNWRCLYLGSPECVASLRVELIERGVDVARELERGALVLSSDRGQPGARFEPRALLDKLEALIDESVAAGFEGLCATGDMAWELGSDTGFERLLEYEALLEKLFHEKPLLGICQYHTSSLPARALQDALLAHPSLYLGEPVSRENLFYLPPDVLLSSEWGWERQCEWLSDQLLRVQNAERERDHAVSAWKTSEVLRIRATDELAQANQELEQNAQHHAQQLDAANKELETFTSSVAHDLRAPLRHIDHYVTHLARGQASIADPHVAEWLARIRESTTHMTGLINGMLALAEASQQELHRELVDLSPLAETIVAQLRRDEPGRAVDLAIEPGLRALGDPALLASALANLFGNAWKFTSKRTDARIEFTKVSALGEDAVFRISDNGVGFAPSAASRLFGIFQRLHSQREFPGTGVGLASVQRIIHRHGGRIWAEGKPEHGASFFFTLPASPGELRPETGGSSAPRAA